MVAESIYKETCVPVNDGPSWAKYMSISGSSDDEYDIITLQYTENYDKPVEATRPLVAVMKSKKVETAKVDSISQDRAPVTTKKVETAKVDSISQDRAPVTPSGPNRCTYLPDPANGSGCHH
uniref:Uncharacterized protein n=1 Tax=Quercus lobata TaxID=97700 RepID=A0A7N2R603_QUELO